MQKKIKKISEFWDTSIFIVCNKEEPTKQAKKEEPTYQIK